MDVDEPEDQVDYGDGPIEDAGDPHTSGGLLTIGTPAETPLSDSMWAQAQQEPLPLSPGAAPKPLEGGPKAPVASDKAHLKATNKVAKKSKTPALCGRKLLKRSHPGLKRSLRNR